VPLSWIAIEDITNTKEDTMAVGMIAFPLPFLTLFLAAVAGALVWRQDFGPTQARLFFVAFFVVAAFGSLVVGLRFGYGFEQLRPIQRAVPLFFGPLLYLGFASQTTSGERVGRLAVLHLGVAFAIAMLPAFLPGAAPGFDWLIGLSYAAYAAMLLLIWRKGPNAMMRARLEIAGQLARWAGLAGGFLLVILVFDTSIALNFARNEGDQAVAMISYGAIVTAALLLGVIFSAAKRSERQRVATAVPRPHDHDTAQIIAAAQDILAREALYRDTGLTADRLAKRLHVPTRALSEAINQQAGMNVSQYVNGFRLRRATELLARTDRALTDVMAQSGFLTRSNFYREFRRAHGQTPVEFRKLARGLPSQAE
jgi:AraC-like DNA-binding protein